MVTIGGPASLQLVALLCVCAPLDLLGHSAQQVTVSVPHLGQQLTSLHAVHAHLHVCEQGTQCRQGMMSPSSTSRRTTGNQPLSSWLITNSCPQTPNCLQHQLDMYTPAG